MALASIASASATNTQKMYIEEKANEGEAKLVHIYDINHVDSVIHENIDNVDKVKILMKGVLNKESFPANKLNQVYFSPTPTDSLIDGSMTNASECKSSSFKIDTLHNFIIGVDTIATYKYDSQNKVLKLNLSSIMGDCCGEGWYVNIATKGDSIFLYPKQLGDKSCNCICHFDVTEELTNIKPQLYHFYIWNNSRYFDIDLSKKEEGSIIDVPKGNFFDNSPCKNELYGMDANATIDSISFAKADSLVSFQFDPESGKGIVVSHNQYLNCCSKKSSIVTATIDTIFIQSVDIYEIADDSTMLACDCICPYDITTQLENLKRKLYTFVVDRTTFSVDLREDIVEEGVIYKGTRGMFVKNSPCKNEQLNGSKGIEEEETIQPTRFEKSDTLVSYFFNPSDREGIIVSHNMMLNCCSEKGSKINVQNDTITIVSTEKSLDGKWCKCTCTYDITSKLMDLMPQKYHFIVDGTEFDVDLRQDSVIEGFISNGPRGMFVKHSPCLNQKEAEATRKDAYQLVAAGDTTVAYQYDPETEELLITSYGMVLNCCSEKESIVTINGDSITIISTENEDHSLWCRCNCTFNITSKIVNLKPQLYHLNVDGRAFDIDCTKKQNGAEIASESSYPQITEEKE